MDIWAIASGVIVGLILAALLALIKRTWQRWIFHRNKLKIIEAKYGMGGQIIDVTSKFSSLIVDNRLQAKMGNHLAGDPVDGVFKIGWIKYQYQGRVQTVIYLEEEKIDIP